MPQHPRTLVALAASQIGQDRKQWIEVILTADETRNGPWFFTITKPDLEVYADSIRKNGDLIHVDYDHAGAYTQGSTRAAGWFTGQAEVRETDKGPRVMAEVQWTPPAAQQIKDGEFRFISPEFSFAEKDKKTGLMTKAKEILAATLTNRPYFRELAPVGSELLESDTLDALAVKYGREVADLVLAGIANENPSARAAAEALITTIEGENMPDFKALATALGLAEDADENTIIEAAKKARAAAEAGKPEPAKPKAKLDAKVLAALELPEDATDEQLVAAVAELKNELASATGVSREALDKLSALATRGVETDRQLLELQREAEQRLHETEKETLFAKAVEDGRILPVHKESLGPLYDLDAARVKAMIEAAPKRSFREIGSGEPGPLDRPAPREIHDRSGNTVVAVQDPEWLDRRAQEILRAQGKAFKNVTEDEYTEALAQAADEAR